MDSVILPCQRCEQWKPGHHALYGWIHLCDDCREELVAIDEERKEDDVKHAGHVAEHARGDAD